MVENMAGTILPEKTFIKDFSGYLIYLGRVEGGELKDVQVYTLDAEGKVESQLRAPSGSIVVNRTDHTITMMLRNVWRTGLIDGKRAPPIGIDETTLPPLKLPDERLERTKLSDMTFLQLQDELQELERRTSGSGSMRGLTREQMVERLRQLAQQRTDLTTPVKVQMHRQISFSFACFGFTLLGIPLGIRVHRRETNVGIAIALVLVAVYYSFILIAQSLESHPELAPHLIVWLPNFLFQAVGAVLLWRANRGV
jgi:lipopolysaccharide export system permease protein